MTPCSINLVTYVSSAFKYLVKYDGKIIETTVTNQGAVAEEWVSEILLVHSDNKNPVVGLDIKWDDSPNELVSNKCSVLLLCIDTKCLILQLLYMDTIPETIKSFLLVSEYGLHCANTEDIRTIVTKKWLVQFGQHGLEYLADGMFNLVIKKPGAVAEEWVSEILLVHSDNKNPVVGLDIKWDDSPNELVSNKCSVLLLCIDTKCLILQLLYMDTIPETIKSFLMNSKFTFMGVKEDMSKLVSEYGLHCANTEDIRTIVTKKWLVQFGQHGLEYLADGMFNLV
nr:hypothetical protein [Tanacetum cinerariifolium]